MSKTTSYVRIEDPYLVVFYNYNIGSLAEKHSISFFNSAHYAYLGSQLTSLGFPISEYVICFSTVTFKHQDGILGLTHLLLYSLFLENLYILRKINISPIHLSGAQMPLRVYD